MKMILILLVASSFWFNGLAQNKVIETLSYDLDGNGIPDSIMLVCEAGFEDDPEIFNQIIIQLDGRRAKSFHTTDCWHTVDAGFRKEYRNAVSSDLIFVFPEDGRTILFLFGYPYPTGRELKILEIKKGEINLVFDREMDEIHALKDLDGDGQIELAGRNRYELYRELESRNADIGTYSPYQVFHLDVLGGMDPELTRVYNEKHYIWVGPEYDAELKVVYPRSKSRPYLWKE